MKKLRALLTALCLVLAILIFNAPDVNYGHGPGYARASVYGSSDS